MKKIIFTFVLYLFHLGATGWIAVQGVIIKDVSARNKIGLIILLLLPLLINFALQIKSDLEKRQSDMSAEKQKNTIENLNNEIEELVKSQNVLIINSMPSHRAFQAVTPLIADILTYKIGWNKFSVVGGGDGNFYSAYVVEEDDVIKQIFWLYSDEFNHILSKPDKISEYICTIFNKAEIDPQNTVSTAWNIIKNAFSPVLEVAFGLTQNSFPDAENHCIAIEIIHLPKKYSDNALTIVEDGDNNEHYLIELPEKILEQLIGKNRAEISKIILDWVYGS